MYVLFKKKERKAILTATKYDHKNDNNTILFHLVHCVMRNVTKKTKTKTIKKGFCT